MKIVRLFLCCWMLCWAVVARAQSAAPTALPPEVQSQLQALLADPALRQAHVGVSIQALGTVTGAAQFPAQAYVEAKKPLLWEHNAQQRFIPASNTKLYTAALALKYFGATHHFATSLQTLGKRRESTSDGALYLVGGGDPALSADDLQDMAAQLKAAGVRRIVGDVVGDGTLFGAETFGGRYPDGWTLDDALWYYGPEVSALAVNRNQVDVTISGTQPRQPARVTIEPAGAGLKVLSQVWTSSPGPQNAAPRPQIQWERAVSGSAIGPVLSLRGSVPPGQRVSEGLAVPNPPLWAAQLLKAALQREGIQVTGVARAFNARQDWALHMAGAKPRTLATVASPPLEVLLAAFLKPSDNLYGEMLLRAVSRFKPQPLLGFQAGTAAASHGMLLDWLRQSGVETAGLQFTDGSGLSRYNLITPLATTQLLAAVETLPDGAAFYAALPIAGVDGTLRNRMKSTLKQPDPAQNNVRAKTGSFSIVSTLSGYVTTRDGHRLAVSILTNFATGSEARRVQNAIFSLLAGSAWPTADRGSAVTAGPIP
jgi:D-alanyl-D-alanine carboxypeptidase/D-alanyl-D-alanine-endopeptidase (penicillin-binding protein 4)